MKFKTKTLVSASLLVAIAILLKNFAITTPFVRFSIFEFALYFVGFLFGPVMALIAGFVTDYVYVIISPFAFTFNLMTISTMMFGFIAAIMLFNKEKITLSKAAITFVLAGLVGFTLNSIQLYIWRGPSMYADLPLRIAIMVVKWPVYTYLFMKMKDRIKSVVK